MQKTIATQSPTQIAGKKEPDTVNNGVSNNRTNDGINDNTMGHNHTYGYFGERMQLCRAHSEVTSPRDLH